MKPVVFALCLAGVPGILGAGAPSATCASGLEQPFEAGRQLRMKIRSSEIDIIGTDEPRVKVFCELKPGIDPARIAIQFEPAQGALRIHGGSGNDNLRLHIEVPKATHLYVRAPAGELRIRDVTGNKDVGLHAGEMTIGVGDPSDYVKAEAGVKVGDLNAAAFGVSKSGFFRSFKTTNANGRYTLRAGVGTGEINLQGSK